MIPWLPASGELVFPPVSSALQEPLGPNGPNGLLAAGGDLSPARILAAYRLGIFPWFSPGEPILWWSPDPRMVHFPAEFTPSRSLLKTLRNKPYEVRLDTAFAAVIAHCAALPREGQNGTWISAEMQAAYIELHRLGYAHSVETWIDGELVGGLYGMAIGKAFFGESMFSRCTDASKIAFAHLCYYLKQREFGIIDCQMETAHLTSLGGKLIPRDEFIAHLEALAETGAESSSEHAPGPWPANAVTDAYRSIITARTS